MPEALLLGLTAAAAFGIGDYLSGSMARRVPLPGLIAVSQAVAVLGLLPLAARAPVDGSAVAWGAAAGLAGLVASYCLLRGYRVGLLAVVSPCASVSAAGIPVLIDLATGWSMDPLTAVGIAAALIAVVLVSFEPGSSGGSVLPAVLWGLAAGGAHAAMYVLIERAPQGQSWSLVTVFVIGGLGGALALLYRRRTSTPRRRTRTLVVPLACIGLTSAAGWMSFQAAAATAGVGIAAVLTELSPALTAVLGWALLRECLPPTRRLGIVIAVTGCACIGLAT